MITKDQLIAAGYNPFKQKGVREYTEAFWQKRFDDDKGKKYFITIAEYGNSEHNFMYSPFTQFESHNVTFDIEMHHPESVEQIEEFFESTWVRMDCNYYSEWS